MSIIQDWESVKTAITHVSIYIRRGLLLDTLTENIKDHFELALTTDASALKRSLIAEGCGSFIPQSHEHRGLSLELDGEQANGTLEKTETSFYFAL